VIQPIKLFIYKTLYIFVKVKRQLSGLKSLDHFR
jgi:hypothetical protein